MFLKSVEQFKPEGERQAVFTVKAGIGPTPWTHKTKAFY